MPSHADSSVNQVAHAYQGNPQALEQRTQATNGMTPELIDLLAYQKLQADKKQAANQMALSAGKQPTVAQGMKDEAMSSAREEVTKSMGLPGLMQSAQGAPQPHGAQPQQPPQGAGLPGAQSNLPQQYQSGGIVAFTKGGKTSDDEDASMTEAERSTMPYGEQMRKLGSALAGIPASVLKTLVSAPGYGFNRNNPTAEAPPAATTNPTYDLDARPEATPAQPTAPARPAPAPRNQGLGGTQPGQARQAATPQAPAPDVPMDVLKGKLLAGVNRDLDVDENVRGAASGKRYEDTIGAGNLARIEAQKQRTEGLRALQEKQAGERPSSFWTGLERMGENTRERGLGGAFKGVSKAVSEANAGYQAQDVKNMGTINSLLDARDKALQENDIGKLKAIEGAIDDARAMHKAAQTTGASLITHDEATKSRMQIADTARKAAAALAGVNAQERRDRLDATIARAQEKQAADLAEKRMLMPMIALQYKDRPGDLYREILGQIRNEAPAPAAKESTLSPQEAAMAAKYGKK